MRLPPTQSERDWDFLIALVAAFHDTAPRPERWGSANECSAGGLRVGGREIEAGSESDVQKRGGMMIGVAIATIAAVGTFCLGAATARAQVSTENVSRAMAVVGAPGAPATETVPRLVQFNGTLKDGAMRPVSGVASVTFAIYAEQDGGTTLWSETQNVLADADGHYGVLLGSATANGVPAELFGTGQSRWLGVTIARQAEMARVLMASVPYALKAADADTLGGLPASAYVTTQSLAAAPANTGTVSGGNTTVIATPQAASTLAPSGIPQATPTGSGTTDFIPIWTSSAVLGNSTIFQSAGLVGIGTTTPAETLDVNGNSIFRGSFQLPPGHPATASSGYESHSFQFQASSYNSATKASDTEAFGFRAEPLGNNTSSPSAKLDLFYGPGGGTLTDTGLSFSKSGIITFAPGQTFNGTSETVNEVNLPNTTGATTGVLALGGNAFVNDFGDPSNTFVGAQAGGAFKSTSANGANSAVGEHALYANTSGTENTAMGGESLPANTTGSQNSALGLQALFLNTTGSGNTAAGLGALQSNTTGTFNVGMGFESGDGNSTGSYNSYLGYQAGPIGDGLTNATAIGAYAIVGSSNSMVLGGTGTNAVKVGIGTTLPGYTLEVDDSGGNGAGLAGISSVAGDNAVFGSNTAGFNTSNGGYFVTNSEAGSGVVGVNTAGGYAGYFGGTLRVAGNLLVDGTVSKGGGSFKIDDPIDPANKFLSHSFVESPDMMNIYNGNVTTDAQGFATVTMPEWFEALNGDFRYQLTAVGQFAQAMVATKIKAGKFTIRTDKPHVEVSWQVTGVRHDAWANAHRIPTEEEKPANEQGYYLHPELFGATPEKSIAAAESPVPGKRASRQAHESH
jgi:hypothetical protein